MTREEIEKKAYEVYPEIREEHTECDINAPYRKAYIKGLTEQLDCPKIKGWVARDEDGTLLFSWGNKPIPQSDGTYDSWDDLWFTIKDDKILPELKHENDPIEVELIVKKV